MSRRARRKRVAALTAVVVALCCAAPASAEVSGGDTPEGPSGILAPAASPPPSISGTEQDGSTLTGTDGFGSASSHDRAWLRCTTSTTGCAKVLDDASTYPLTPADVGKFIKFRVRGSHLLGDYREADATTGEIDAISPANGTAPAFTGTPRSGQTLLGNQGSWTGTPTVGFTYRWQRCNPGCADIPGGAAGGINYTLTIDDIGTTVRFKVTATRAENAADTTTVFSGQSATVQALTNTALPQVSGTAQRGQILTATNGTWAGNGPISYAFSWERCSPACVAIASGSSYALSTADVGSRMRVKVTATGADGSAVAYSALTGVVTSVSSGGGSGGGSGTTTPGGTTTLRKLSPFPVVAIGGRLIRGRVLVSLLRVSRAPRGAIVTATCRGRGCPFRRTRRTIRRRAGLRIRELERRLRKGTVITIIVRKGNTIGKYTRLRIRRGAPPARIDRCIRPGATRPSACP